MRTVLLSDRNIFSFGLCIRVDDMGRLCGEQCRLQRWREVLARWVDAEPGYCFSADHVCQSVSLRCLVYLFTFS